MQHRPNVSQADADEKDIQSGIRLPPELWRRAKIAAVQHDTTLKQIAIEGLELRLKQLEPEKVRR